MKSRILALLLATLLPSVVLGSSERDRQAAVEMDSPLSRGGLGALEHASKLIIAINSLDWKSVDAVRPQDIWISMLKRDATQMKDWHGIGGFRGSELRDRELTLRFAYGSRTTPHEVWFTYTLSGDAFKLKAMTILGW